MQTKIAIATEDGIKVSLHFGRAPYYEVVTLEDGKIVARERREKAHHQTGEHSHDHSSHGALHGDMISAAQGCVAVIAGGMGNGAFQSLKSAGLVPVITTESEIEKIALAYATGALVNHTERLH